MPALADAKIEEIRTKIKAGQRVIALTGALMLENVEYIDGRLYAEINNHAQEGCDYEITWSQGNWSYTMTGGMCYETPYLFEEDISWQDVLIEAVRWAMEHPRGGE